MDANQIDPAIEAARIGAHAMRQAAWIQAGGTTLAVVAGALAYFGAVRQVRIQERHDKARRSAYRFRLRKIVESFKGTARLSSIGPRAQLASFQRLGGSQVIQPWGSELHFPVELNDVHWEDHAMLGELVVARILVAKDAMDKLSAFDQQVREGRTATDGHLEEGSIANSRSIEKGEEVTIEITYESAIVDYVAAFNVLDTALSELLKAIDGPVNGKLKVLARPTAWWCRRRRAAASSPKKAENRIS